MVKVNEKYTHYKRGGKYKVVAIAKHHETTEDWVVYKSEGSGETYVRPRREFEEVVDHDGARVTRFRKL